MDDMQTGANSAQQSGGADALARPTASTDGVLAALDEIRAAWDAGDASAYAGRFTEDASYVIFAGLHDLGRESIRRTHVPVFGKWQKESRMTMRVLDLRFLSADVAVVLTEGHVGTGPRPPRRFDKVQTFVMVRRGGEWMCAAFQNTKRNRLFAWVNRLADRR
ncbi:SgcJ/EcaC family oxidoreductase [Agromyces archimandritae]|uniref:SgcJ/EcaC family oxidoreductase n=1 Tax=Agromyces archimandritae TaxID=2781962 RepID=A0A975FJI6_9MICO|nr:SgcJ/EcaC family oxidoreductase [Agromyces archimandritae]QTX03678.1 SgcJ/EcaC family oxidoreductase [Agromyces archimandritae]